MKLLALLFSLSSALFVTVLPRREECFHETGKAGDKVSTQKILASWNARCNFNFSSI